jgi:hypothetical protein
LGKALRDGMKFPVQFQRFKPATGSEVLLGSDSAPPNDEVPQNTDNMLAVRGISINGWPPHRIAVVCRYKGAGPVANITMDVFFWESGTGAWYPMEAAAKTVVPNGIPTFFDIIVPTDFPNVKAGNPDAAPGTGNPIIALVPHDTGGVAANGEYDFAACVDLTTSPF